MFLTKKGKNKPGSNKIKYVVFQKVQLLVSAVIKHNFFSPGYLYFKSQFLHPLDPCIQITLRSCCSDFWKSHCSHALGLTQRGLTTLPISDKLLNQQYNTHPKEAQEVKATRGKKARPSPAQPFGEGQCKQCCYILQLSKEPEYKHSSGTGVGNCFQEAPG